MASKKGLSHPGQRPPTRAAGGRWLAPQSKSFALPQPSLQRKAQSNPIDGPQLAWQRTLVAKGCGPLARKHLRFQALSKSLPLLHCIVLDTSGSMRQDGRLALAKGFAARLIEVAARAGDDVALLCFGGRGGELLMPPGPARASGVMHVRQCGGGGGTPLAQALAVAQGLLSKPQSAALWLLTDGRTLEQPIAVKGVAHTVIVDFDDPKRGLGRCAALAKRWGAEHRLAPF